MRRSRGGCQGAVGVVPVPVRGGEEGVLDIVHEVEHLADACGGGFISWELEEVRWLDQLIVANYSGAEAIDSYVSCCESFPRPLGIYLLFPKRHSAKSWHLLGVTLKAFHQWFTSTRRIH